MTMWGRRSVGRLYRRSKATGIKRISYLLGGEPMKAWLSFLGTAVVCVAASRNNHHQMSSKRWIV